MAPTKLMIIRHAEKPDGQKFKGVDLTGQATGDQGKKHLITIGWQRAGALVTLFAPPWGPKAGLETPASLFASNPGPGAAAQNGNGDPSQRPYETLLPIATKLGIGINTDYSKDDYDAMIAAALTKNGAILVAWQHEDIPLLNKSKKQGISQSILTQTKTPAGANLQIPSQWPKDKNGNARYDLIWVFDLSPGDGTVHKFTQVPQFLLASDTAV